MQFVAGVGHNRFAGRRYQPGQGSDYTAFRAGGASCTRAFLMERGVFNPALGAGCEDMELGYRLSWHGFHVVHEPRARRTMIQVLGYEDVCREAYLRGRSNWIFAAMHDSSEVRRCAEIDGLEDTWRALAPCADDLLLTGRRLDDLVGDRLGAGLSVDRLTLALLHRSYERAFSASRLKGSFDCMRETAAATHAHGA
jgi:hypothetical protein